MNTQLDAKTLSTVLIAKLQSLQNSVLYWRSISDADADGVPASVFRHNHSQIVRLCELFDGILSSLNEQFTAFASESDSDPFDQSKRLNRKLLQGHELWAYFQDKLMIRHSAGLRDYLHAADEFAWACFEPLAIARGKALENQTHPVNGGSNKIPPLIYLGQPISPLVRPRSWSMKNDLVEVSDELFQTVVASAPFSFISLPYHQTAHLPETMVLAHEMGHVVEIDLGLADDLNQFFERIPDSIIAPERKSIWKRCRVEAFADVFGAVVGGSAFCLALAQFLADDRDTIVNAEFGKRTKYEYPTCYLRVLLCLQVLRDAEGNLPPAAQKVEQSWFRQYGREHKQADFEADLPALVASMVDSPLPALNAGGNRTIRDLVGLSRRDEDDAIRDAQGMIQSGSNPESTDARALFAAATFAFDQSPSNYQGRKVEARVLKRISHVASDETRNDRGLLEATGLGCPGSANEDRETGRRIADLFG